MTIADRLTELGLVLRSPHLLIKQQRGDTALLLLLLVVQPLNPAAYPFAP